MKFSTRLEVSLRKCWAKATGKNVLYSQVHHEFVGLSAGDDFVNRWLEAIGKDEKYRITKYEERQSIGCRGEDWGTTLISEVLLNENDGSLLFSRAEAETLINAFLEKQPKPSQLDIFDSLLVRASSNDAKVSPIHTQPGL